MAVRLYTVDQLITCSTTICKCIYQAGTSAPLGEPANGD